MLYLINCEITKYYYMDGSKKEKMTHIVEADNEELAIIKINKFYEQKNSSYDIYYEVNINYCNEVIK